MTTVFCFVIRGVVLAILGAGWAGLLAGAVLAQGVGMPGVGLPGVGIGNPSMNLPQRQGPMVGGGAGGAPGQMNSPLGGAGTRPGQGVGMRASNTGRSRGAGLMGVPQSATAFSGRASGANIQRSGRSVSNRSRNLNVPGIGNVGARR